MNPPPHPDPPPAAHQQARIDWAYGIEIWSKGHRYWIWTPVRGKRTFRVMTGRHL